MPRYPDHTTESVSNKARACPDGCAHAERLRAVAILTVESARELGCGASAEPPIEAVRDAGDRPGNTVCLSRVSPRSLTLTESRRATRAEGVGEAGSRVVYYGFT